jgi:hypothetical protein
MLDLSGSCPAAPLGAFEERIPASAVLTINFVPEPASLSIATSLDFFDDMARRQPA